MPLPQLYFYTEEQLRNAVKYSSSLAETLRFLGIPITGSHYGQIRPKIQKLALDTSHFKGQSWSRGKTFLPNVEKATAWLCENSNANRDGLKKRQVKLSILENKCAVCGNTGTWCDTQLVLHLDHINGKNRDNRLDNLRLLCPNCHSQTETFAGKNKKRLAEQILT